MEEESSKLYSSLGVHPGVQPSCLDCSSKSACSFVVSILAKVKLAVYNTYQYIVLHNISILKIFIGAELHLLQ